MSVWILEFKGESLDSNLDSGKPEWILGFLCEYCGFQSEFLDSGFDPGILV